MSRFFIARPIFACVLALLVVAFGVLAIQRMPVERYPDIAPPSVSISATYSGATAQTVEDSVTQVLEQQIQGIDHLHYYSSSSSSSGQVRISLTFEQGTDPDVAQVQVQNSIDSAINRLPASVRQSGVRVTKSQGDSLMVIGLYDTTGQRSSVDISDYLVNQIQPVIGRINGVGETNVFGSQYAMRIWLDPEKLASYGLMPSDVRAAILAQNTQVTAGEIGAPPVTNGSYLNATVSAMSRLQTPEEFRQIVLKAQPTGAVVTLRDVARVELGAENYQVVTRLNGYPGSGMSISLSSGANALAVSRSVREQMTQLEKQLPAGLKIAYPRDNTPFVEASIHSVITTLIEAIVLVIAVMYLFLHRWRATLIPAVAVPVVLLGTFGVLSVLGFSINSLTLFAMVLAIGLLVDDAIVVVENVERVMHETGQLAPAATLQSMQEISGALVGITLVISAVFIPMAFFGGAMGVIYQQFSVTIVSAMVLSVLVANTLTPALCAVLLTPADAQAKQGFGAYFDRTFSGLQNQYSGLIRWTVRHRFALLAVFALCCVGMVAAYRSLPTSFLPDEDQGTLTVQFSLREGAPLSQTEQLGKQIANYFMSKEGTRLNAILITLGRNNSGNAQNIGQAFVSLKHWDERKGKADSADAIIERANKHFKKLRDAKVTVNAPSAVRGLGQSSGFEFWLQDVRGAGHEALVRAQKALIEAAEKRPEVQSVRMTGLDDQPQLKVQLDQTRIAVMGVPLDSVTSTLSTAWGGDYVNDFIDRGRVKRVMVQGDSAFRSSPDDLGKWQVRGSDGQMVSFASFSQSKWLRDPQILKRFNGIAAIQINGNPATGVSSGEAMHTMESLVTEQPGMGLAWSGLSWQEKQSSGKGQWLYLISAGFIFLCLAALYESWSIPLAVLLVIPLGVIGAILGTKGAGFANDVFFQVAILATIGLSTKNAILIIEYAAASQRAGLGLIESALHAAHLRLRPIIMTSLAFVAGVIPLVFATGAGALSRQEIGVSIASGVISGTVLTLLYVPVFYVLIMGLVKSGRRGIAS